MGGPTIEQATGDVLDATLVWFDADGTDTDLPAARPGIFTSKEALDEFAERFVGGDRAR